VMILTSKRLYRLASVVSDMLLVAVPLIVFHKVNLRRSRKILILSGFIASTLTTLVCIVVAVVVALRLSPIFLMISHILVGPSLNFAVRKLKREDYRPSSAC